MRLAEGRAAGHGRADAGRDLRIEEIDVEADMQQAVAPRSTVRITSRMMAAAPRSSTVRMSKTLTPRSPIASRSAGSIERMPSWKTLFGGTSGRSAGRMPVEAASPQKKATGMPCMLPDGEVCGVLKSAWASSQSTKSGRPTSAA